MFALLPAWGLSNAASTMARAADPLDTRKSRCYQKTSYCPFSKQELCQRGSGAESRDPAPNIFHQPAQPRSSFRPKQDEPCGRRARVEHGKGGSLCTKPSKDDFQSNAPTRRDFQSSKHDERPSALIVAAPSIMLRARSATKLVGFLTERAFGFGSTAAKSAACSAFRSRDLTLK